MPMPHRPRLDGDRRRHGAGGDLRHLRTRNTLVLGFDADLPAGGRLHYAHGNTQLIGAGGTAEGNAIYDDQGLPLSTPAAGLLIGAAAIPLGFTQFGTGDADAMVAGPDGDTLIGGPGNDYMVAGAGADDFVLSPRRRQRLDRRLHPGQRPHQLHRRHHRRRYPHPGADHRRRGRVGCSTAAVTTASSWPMSPRCCRATWSSPSRRCRPGRSTSAPRETTPSAPATAAHADRRCRQRLHGRWCRRRHASASSRATATTGSTTSPPAPTGWSSPAASAPAMSAPRPATSSASPASSCSMAARTWCSSPMSPRCSPATSASARCRGAVLPGRPGRRRAAGACRDPAGTIAGLQTSISAAARRKRCWAPRATTSSARAAATTRCRVASATTCCRGAPGGMSRCSAAMPATPRWSARPMAAGRRPGRTAPTFCRAWRWRASTMATGHCWPWRTTSPAPAPPTSCSARPAAPSRNGRWTASTMSAAAGFTTPASPGRSPTPAISTATSNPTSLAPCRWLGRALADGRHRVPRWRHLRPCGQRLEHCRRRRFQRRWPFGHPLAQRRRRAVEWWMDGLGGVGGVGGGGLGQVDAAWQVAGSPISTATARRTSCGAMPMAASRCGCWTAPPASAAAGCTILARLEHRRHRRLQR